jgi:hypothetical protein
VINPTFPLVVGPGGGPVPVTVRFRPTNLTGQLNKCTRRTDRYALDCQQRSGDVHADREPVRRTDDAQRNPGAGHRWRDCSGEPAEVADAAEQRTEPQFKQSLSNIVPASASICGNPPVIYHLDNETLPPAGTTGANPKSSYTLTAQNNGKPISTSFTLGQCEMKIFTLQYK